MNMNEYLKQAKNFLNNANAKCEIVYGGISRNENWKEKEKRNWYDVTITTPRGKMTFIFWDSIHNTKISTMTFEEYAKKKFKCNRVENMLYREKVKVKNDLARLKAEAVPNEYDVLACLEKYDPGTFENFCSEFGYDEDSRTAERIYIAVIKEYKDLTRIFTKEQIEEAGKYCEIEAYQPQYSMLDGDNEAVIRWAAAQDMGIMSYGTLGGGILTGTYREVRTFGETDNRNRFYPYFREPLFSKVMELLEVMDTIASERGVPLAQIAVNWTLQQPFITSCIAGAQSRKKVEENCAGLEWQLTEDEMHRLDQAIQRYRH